MCTFSIINIYSLCWMCSFERRFCSALFRTLSPSRFISYSSFIIATFLCARFVVFFSLCPFFCLLFQLRICSFDGSSSLLVLLFFIVKQIYHKRPCLDPHTCHGPAPCKSACQPKKTMQTRCVDSVFHFVTGPYVVHYCSIDWMIRNYKIIWCIRNICNVAVAAAFAVAI